MLKVIITCEHGGNQIPEAYAELFAAEQALLESHKGYDIGALELFDALKDLADKSFYATNSRLLVELNRSPHHKTLFSELTQNLPKNRKSDILKNYYYPYRERVEELVHDLTMVGHQVLHVAIHTFTPVMDGLERQADIGLLYDPRREGERVFCRSWKKALLHQQKDLKVRFNYPYLGIADGFPTYLRRRFTNEQYMGIELEVNQKFPLEHDKQWERIQKAIKSSLKSVILQMKAEEQVR
ncbi:N-formylglutamate amidohydrolase [uncultured Pontibacter sp.]|uniref:N-formylglutamate amidohydrolase n=1 Tax=uncultured Pontibacter sp. TaxID=453356 RepID=UPI002606763C|nr:N-formylglutamate amidohydrolase [uncultured Pontibacter sp.]